MADLAHATEGDSDLHGVTDATHWAERFVLVRHNLFTGPERRDIAEDADTMLAWFAGAIETGRMAGYRQGRDDEAAGEPTEATP